MVTSCFVSGTVRKNRFLLKHDRFRLDLKKNFLILRIIKKRGLLKAKGLTGGLFI